MDWWSACSDLTAENGNQTHAPEGRAVPLLALPLLVFCAGFAALSWEVIWQLKSSLSLGFSALGAAITLATTMGGMTAGSLLMGRLMRRWKGRKPLALYAALEATIGVSGLFLASGFRFLESLDAQIYRSDPGLSPLVQALGTVLLLGLPTMAMGATIPVFRAVASGYGTSISRLYALNTAGAAIGSLVLALFLIPAWGVTHCTYAVAGLNLLVAAISLALPAVAASDQSGSEPEPEVATATTLLSPPATLMAVALTGFATFALEVAWFRSLKAAFYSTTESFAIMLSAVLIAIALGARLAPLAQKSRFTLAGFLLLAGLTILLATPLVERFDLLSDHGTFPVLLARRLASCVLVLGTPIALMGVTLPWILDCQKTPEECARVYAFNTLGSILGALLAAWLLLPGMGFARTSWLAGSLVGLFALSQLRLRRLPSAVGLALCLLVAVSFESGIGRDRVQLRYNFGPMKILQHREGPDATISVVENLKLGIRDLLIDGFAASGDHPTFTHYMPWMGHLPMILHPDPQRALVICFGTGQTANAVREENPQRLDIVDLNAAVFEMAHLFPVNNSVLKDPRVFPTVMDGRAWMRRAPYSYDVITLEPMPPNFAGVNNLYSKEFYELARANLNPGGVVAQWVPCHLMHADHSRSVAATFQRVFPNSGLWIDPVSFTGILVGVKGETPVGSSWPGLEREIWRSLTDKQIKAAMILDPRGLQRYVARHPHVTDDNQMLSYGSALMPQTGGGQKGALRHIHWASTLPPPKEPSHKVLLEMRTEPLERPR